MHENALLPLILRTFIMYFVKPQFIMDHQDNNDTPELFYWMENGIERNPFLPLIDMETPALAFWKWKE